MTLADKVRDQLYLEEFKYPAFVIHFDSCDVCQFEFEFEFDSVTIAIAKCDVGTDLSYQYTYGPRVYRDPTPIENFWAQYKDTYAQQIVSRLSTESAALKAMDDSQDNDSSGTVTFPIIFDERAD